MHCTTCGAAITPDDVFCGTCGADLGSQRAAVAAPAQAPAPAPVVAPYPTSGSPGALPAAPRKSKLPLIITIVVVGILLSCGCVGVAGFALYAPVRQAITQIDDVPAEESVGSVEASETPAPVGYDSAEEAVKAEIPTDWIIREVSADSSRAEYWAGPPASEFTTVYIAEVDEDGAWRVSETQPLEESGEDSP